MHDIQNIESSIIAYLKKAAVESGDEVEVLSTTDLFDEAVIDSFGIVELIEFVDQKFCVDLTPVDFYVGEQRTAAGIASYIHDNISK